MQGREWVRRIPTGPWGRHVPRVTGGPHGAPGKWSQTLPLVAARGGGEHPRQRAAAVGAVRGRETIERTGHGAPRGPEPQRPQDPVWDGQIEDVSGPSQHGRYRETDIPLLTARRDDVPPGCVVHDALLDVFQPQQAIPTVGGGVQGDVNERVGRVQGWDLKPNN